MHAVIVERYDRNDGADDLDQSWIGHGARRRQPKQGDAPFDADWNQRQTRCSLNEPKRVTKASLQTPPPPNITLASERSVTNLPDAVTYHRIAEPIEMADSPVTFDMKILKNSTCFRPRRAVGFDRAGGAIESNCPSGSKTCRIFQNFHVESDGTVRHFDGFRYTMIRHDVNQCCSNGRHRPRGFGRNVQWALTLLLAPASDKKTACRSKW